MGGNTVRATPAVSLLAAGSLAIAGHAHAGTGWACEDIGNDTIVMGELDYDVNSGTDTCFANAYEDGTTELALPWKAKIGGCSAPFPGQSGTLDIGFYFFLYDDVTTDSATVTFTMGLHDDDAQEAGAEPNCLDDETEHVHSFARVLNTSDMPPALAGCMGTDCQVAAGKWVGVVDHPCLFADGTFRKWWWARIGVSGDECVAAVDYGCAEVLQLVGECPGGTGDY